MATGTGVATMAGKVAKIELFACTPRAGNNRHVYLVTEDNEDVRRSIQSFATHIDRIIKSGSKDVDSNDIHFHQTSRFAFSWRIVQHPVDGREGVEWLCVRVSAPRMLDKLSDLDTWLRDCLLQLEEEVTSIEWPMFPELFRQIPQLRSWQSDLENRLSNSSRRSRRLFGPLIAALCCILLLFFLVPLGFTQSLSEIIKRLIRGDNSNPPASHMTRLAECLGTNNDPHAIYEKLARLFNFQARTNLSDRTTDLKSVDDICDSFHKAMQVHNDGCQPKGDECYCQFFYDRLKLLFPNGRYDPLGILKHESRQTNDGVIAFWDGYTFDIVYELGKEYNSYLYAPEIHNLNREALDRIKLFYGTQYSKVYRAIENLDGYKNELPGQLHSSANSDANGSRTFFIPQDRRLCEIVMEVMRSILRDLSPSAVNTAREVPNGLERFRKDLERFTRNIKEWRPEDIPTEQYESLKNKIHLLNTLVGRWQDKLLVPTRQR
jgi:hypothetical protein